MTIRTFGIGCAVVLGLLLGYGVFLLINQWVYSTVGGQYEIRQNRLTGKVQIQDQGRWAETMRIAPVGDPLTVEQLQRIRLKDMVWTTKGLLVGKATVAPGGGPLRGRLAFQIVVIARNGKRRLTESERNLRRSVDWPEGTAIPFVLDTEFKPPVFGDTSTVAIVPILLDNAGNAAGLKLPEAAVPSPFTAP